MFDADLPSIREYYGEEVMLYFAWVSYYNMWLVAPVCLGLLLMLANIVFGLDNDNNPLVPFYSIFVMVVGSSLFEILATPRSWALRNQYRLVFSGPVEPPPSVGSPLRSIAHSPDFPRLPSSKCG